MILSDKTIRKMLDDPNCELEVSGVERVRIESASIDLTLGNSFAYPVPKDKILTLDTEIEYNRAEYASTQPLILPSKGTILATTQEYIKLPKDVAAFITGRSSIGRLGLFIENAGFIDPAFQGQLTLELYNSANYPIRLEIGRRVAQIVLFKLDEESENPYCGKYQGQMGAVSSKIFLDDEVLIRKNKNEAKKVKEKGDE